MDGIALMATAMRAAQARLDVSAANLANVSTDGFRKHVAMSAIPSMGASYRRRVAAPFHGRVGTNGFALPAAPNSGFPLIDKAAYLAYAGKYPASSSWKGRP